MPDRFHHARLTDAVHGTYGLSELEADIISTPVFQRLHNVRQLGLAHLVFPGADYSRFAHSLGACHVAGRMLRSINQLAAHQFNDDDIQMYRLAGLLHDLGHYPFSHAMEYAALDHYNEQAFIAPTDGDAAGGEGGGLPAAPQQQANPADPPPAYHHEQLGRAILEHDPLVGKVLNKHNISRDDLKSILSREKPNWISSLVSSDLDCDRLDYLMRTAHCAGLPYGTVDVEYITTQITIDSQNNLCLTKKALRAADHLLVSRYYDYTQVVFHKTVVGLEITLRDVIHRLIQRNLFDCSGARMKQMILGGSFASFDDQYMIAQLREARQALQADDSLRPKIDSVLNRRPPKLVAAHEEIAQANANRLGLHHNLAQQLEEKMREASEHFGIEPDLWLPWKTDLKLTKIGSRIPLSGAVGGGEFEEEVAQAVRILTTEPDDPESSSKPLVELDSALMKQLSESKYYSIRVYVHLAEDDDRRSQIETFFRNGLPNFPYAL